MEDLLSRCFNVGGRSSSSANGKEDLSEEEREMCRVMMEEERTALQSIYGGQFAVKIPGRVWEIRLQIKGLPRYVERFGEL